MLKANVGLSRKITRDYNSTGYSVNLDGEILTSVDDPQAILEKIKELFSLAQEAVAQEIDRDQGEDAIGRRDEEQSPSRLEARGNGNAQANRSNGNLAPQANQPNGNNASPPGQDQLATNKQVQFLLTMGKRSKLSNLQLEDKIGEIIGRRCGVYQLTKKEAGIVLDHMTNNGNASDRQRS